LQGAVASAAERCGPYRGRGHGPLEQPPAGERVHVSIVPGGRSAGLSARPRDEPPHVALGPARAGLDAEARGLDAALGLAVPVAAAAEARPQRLPAVLHAP